MATFSEDLRRWTASEMLNFLEYLALVFCPMLCKLWDKTSGPDGTLEW